MRLNQTIPRYILRSFLNSDRLKWENKVIKKAQKNNGIQLYPTLYHCMPMLRVETIIESIELKTLMTCKEWWRQTAL